MATILPNTVTLTPNADFVPDGIPVDTLVVAPGTLNAGDNITLTLGARAMQLTEAGSYDMTVPAHLSGVQSVVGSDGNDVLIVDQQHLDGMLRIDLGHGSNNVVQSAFGGRLDLSNVEIVNASIRGRLQNDQIIGTQGNDRIIPGGGSADMVDGNDGRDAVVTDAFFAQVHELPPDPVATLVEGTRVFDIGGGNLYLRHVERLELRDGVMLFDQGATGAEAWRIVNAAVGRVPLEAEIIVAQDLFARGHTTEQVAQNLMSSLAFQQLYGTNTTDAQFVDALYRVVLHRDADAGGRAVQLDALAHGVSRASLLVAFADTAEHVALIGRAATNDSLFVAEVGIA